MGLELVTYGRGGFDPGKPDANVVDRQTVDQVMHTSGVVDLGGSVFVASSPVLITEPGTHIRNGTIRAADDATFETLVKITADDCTLENVTIDANGPARSASVAGRMLGVLVSSSDRFTARNVTVTGTLGSGSVSAVGMALSACHQAVIEGCRFLDCGTAERRSDGLFVRGNQVTVTGCIASACTDTGFVFEGSNHSGMSGCISYGCGAAAAIVGSGSATFSGCYISGLTVHDWNAANTGAIQIGLVGAAWTGTLKDVSVSDVVMVRGGGAGPAIKVRNISTAGGTVHGVSLRGVSIDGSSTQGILLDKVSDVVVADCQIRDTTDSALQINAGCSGVTVTGCHLKAGSFGVSCTDADHVTVSGCTIDGGGRSGAWGAYFFGTGTAARVANLTAYDCPRGRTGADAGTFVALGPTDG